MKTIQSNGKEFTLYHTTGKVTGTNKNFETIVHGGGGANNSNVQISSSTIIHDQLFLYDKSNNEHSFQLQGFNVACKEGQELAVIWGIKKGANTGPYLLVHNFSTRQTYYRDGMLASMLRYSGWYAVAASVIAFLLMGASFILGMALLIGTWIWWFIKASGAVTKFKSEIDFNEFK